MISLTQTKTYDMKEDDVTEGLVYGCGVVKLVSSGYCAHR